MFVGNAWDPKERRENPWIDIARQLAGDEGVEALGEASRTTPPGTDSIARVFSAANAPVLLLFDEVLNFLNRHRAMADSFHSFIQNLNVATTSTTHGAAVISPPRSQVEMTDWDMQWQERITKVVRRVAKDLIANDENEISEVVRRRLFEDLGSEKTRKNVAAAFAGMDGRGCGGNGSQGQGVPAKPVTPSTRQRSPSSNASGRHSLSTSSRAARSLCRLFAKELMERMIELSLYAEENLR